MENLIIREACEEDAEKIIEYLNIIAGESDNLTFGKGELNIPLEKEKAIIRSMNYPKKSRMFLGLINGEIVSMGSLGVNEKKRLCHRAEIGISVKKKYWNKKIGTRIMEKAIEFAKESGITVIELQVKSDNINAIKLYEKMGFEKIGIYKNFLKIKDKYYDFILMNLYMR